jgi:pilus assembly protein CpaC
LGNGKIRLELRPEIAEIDESRSATVGDQSVPAVRVHTVDTAAEIRPGQTMVIGGLVQTRRSSTSRKDASKDRQEQSEQEEIELIVLATPEIIDAGGTPSIGRATPIDPYGPPPVPIPVATPYRTAPSRPR